MKNATLMTVVGCIAFLASTTAFSQTTNPPDLDRDGIPNITDRDVDNDGILNGSDRNIDGGTARSGPLRGRVIGDNLPNDSSQELDMDADGLADIAVAETDIDGDGLADNASNETDIDGDARLDGERRETDIDGDGLADDSTSEIDIDGDGLADNAASETDIDGDGLADDVRGEVDIDGDSTANGLDGDVDGDGLANNSDADMLGSNAINDIFVGADSAYAPDATVAATINYVSGEIRRILQIPSADNGLRVRVSASQSGNRVVGVWRYLSADNMQVYANWAYPADNPSALNIFAVYQYTGPHSGNMADYTNPDNYSLSEESKAYAQFPGGGITFVSWVPSQPASFFYTAPNQQATGFAPPFQPLVNALSSLPNFTADQQYLSFSGNLGTSPGLSSLQPLINLQRTIMQVSRAWYGQLEAQQIR
jgi:hypothetical protein